MRHVGVGGPALYNATILSPRRNPRLFENKRRLSGQSDLLGDLILAHAPYAGGPEGSLALNYAGERIVLVGAENAPNIVEGARAQLDFLLRYAFDLRGFPLEVEFKARNLLDADVEWTQGGLLYERYAPGIGYSLSLKARTGR